MQFFTRIFFKDVVFSVSVIFLLSISVFVLSAIAPDLFPEYFIYIFIGICAYFLFARIDFEVMGLFSTHIYVLCNLLLILTLVIGQVTRGTIRWIPIGPISLQPAELVRPFLILFFASYLSRYQFSILRLFKALLLLLLPTFLILIQPSLGVAVLTAIAFAGVIFAMSFEKKYILIGLIVSVSVLPLFWFVLRPYQRERILTFTNPQSDPLGTGYNSLQSMIAVGSGKIFGRNLGEGVQTQLAFLPEKQTDFIFAAIAEELGFVGAGLLLLSALILLSRLSYFIENSVSPEARAYLSGFTLTFFAQVIVHVGMNMGLLPVAGLPFPLVSAGGSSLLATMIGLGIALSAFRR